MMSVKRTPGPRPAPESQVPAAVQWEFGQQLREAQTAADLTLAGIAETTGMQPSHISEIKNGLHNVTVETMNRPAAAVGLDLKIELTPIRPEKR
jgi:transcriptional regulator with XRE-family HTH domain